MRLALSILFAAWALAADALILDAAFLRPRYPDPSRMRFSTRKGKEGVVPFVTAMPKDGYTAFTEFLWLKMDPSTFPTTGVAGFYNLSASGFFSTWPGISSTEGGPTLTNLCPFAYGDGVPLDGSGKWSADILPAEYDDGGVVELNANMSDWAYGVYAVNIDMEAATTLTVAGYTTNMVPTGAKQVFNVKGRSADRTVSISTTAGTTVNFGIAENPMRQFFDATISNWNDGMGPREDFAGIGTNEYTLVAVRAKINADQTITTDISAHTWDASVWEGERTYAQKRPRSDFAKYARIAFQLYSLGGVRDNYNLYVYGGWAVPEWLPNSMISSIRDEDARRMMCRGVEFPRSGTNYWALTYEAKREYSDGTTAETATEDASGANLVTATRTQTWTPAVVMGMVNGRNRIEPYTVDDLEFSCAGATSIVDSVIYFPGAGTYTVFATDPSGNAKSIEVHSPASGSATTSTTQYESDSEGWQKTCNDAVADAVCAATTDGELLSAKAWSATFSYQKVRARRIECSPIASTAGTTFDKAVQVISPHCFATANHYGYVHAGTVTYASADGAITNSATVEGGDFYHHAISSTVHLGTWALTNGFTAAEVAAADIDDIAVGVFAEGAVDASICPWFMDAETAAKHFNATRVLGWTTTQTDLGWGLPCSIRPNATNGCDFMSFYLPSGISSWPKMLTSSAGSYDTLTCLDALNRMLAHGETLPNGGFQFPRHYPGDSGMGVYLDLGGKLIRVSHGWKVGGWNGTGSSFVKGHAILKAFVESHGDTLKTIE